MALVLLDGFEHGKVTAAGGGLFGAISGTPTAPTSPAPPYGARALRCLGDNVYVRHDFAAPSNVFVAHLRVYNAVRPGASTSIFQFQDTALITRSGFWMEADGTIRLLAVEGAGSVVLDVSGPVIAASTWTRYSLLVDASANPWSVKWSVNGTAQTDQAPVIPATTFEVAYMGHIDAPGATCDNSFEDLAVWDTAADYSATRNVAVLGYLPNAVGTHNLDAATSVHFFKDVGGTETALTNSETTSWQVLDDSPIDADTDHIILRTAAGSPTVPVYQAAASHSGNPTTAPSATLGTTAADDVLICVVSSGGSNTIPTLAGTYSGGAWTAIDSAALATTGAVAAYWSRCTGNHTGQTVTSTTVDSGSLTVARYNNVLATATPIGANKIESATTNAANSKVVLVVGADDNLAVVTAASAGGNALTVRSVPTSSGGADSGVGIADRDQATAGTSGAITTTWGANAAGTGKYLLAFELLGAPSVTQPTNTWYAEYGFAASGETTDPLAVRAITRIRNDSGVTANSLTVKLRANSAETNIFSGDVASASDIYKSLVSAAMPGGGAWTDALFDAATIRTGYSSDADSGPRVEAALLEALFTIAAGGGPVTANAPATGASASAIVPITLVTRPAGTVTALGIAPAPVPRATVLPAAVTANAAAITPAKSAVVLTTAALATASAPAPTVVTGGSPVTANAPATTALGIATAPVVLVAGLPAAALATAAAVTPTPIVVRTTTAALATALAPAATPVVTRVATASIALGLTPTPTPLVVVLSTASLAVASAPAPIVVSGAGSTATPGPALATASAPSPAILVVRTTTAALALASSPTATAVTSRAVSAALASASAPAPVVRALVPISASVALGATTAPVTRVLVATTVATALASAAAPTVNVGGVVPTVPGSVAIVEATGSSVALLDASSGVLVAVVDETGTTATATDIAGATVVIVDA
jgi:hypothetical protein